MAPQPHAPGTSPAVATPPTVAPPNSPLAPTPTSPAPTLPNPPNPMQPVNPALNPSAQRIPEIGNPTPPIGAPQYQPAVPPLQPQTVGGASGSGSSQGSPPSPASDYDRCMAMWGPKARGALTTRQDWETSCRKATGK
jgi:hypothetical protein